MTDTEFENITENFFAILSGSADRVDITRRETEVEIEDDDSKPTLSLPLVLLFHRLMCLVLVFAAITIGFNPTSYQVNETDGTISLIVELLGGRLSPGVEIEISFATSDGSGEGTKDTSKQYY